jgi:amino acid adenylation domain-containing protein
LAYREQTNYPVLVSIDDLGKGFDLTVQTDPRINPQRMLAYLRTALGSLVEALESAPETRASLLRVLPEDEYEFLIRSINATSMDHQLDKGVHEVFEAQAQRTPDAVAVEHEGRRLTYAQLNRKANQLARYLAGQGVVPGQVVGICMERGLQMVVGILGIVKAGGAYLPLDPNYPTERLRLMLEDAEPEVVLTEAELVGALPEGRARVIAIAEKLDQIATYVGENLSPTELGLSCEHLVYVIYTSGSTGRPKGTAMRHRSMANLIQWHRSTFGSAEGQRVLQFAALSFDVAFQEIFSTLCTGGTLVLLDEWVRRDTPALVELLTRQSIQRLFLPPLMLQSIAEYCKSASAVPQGLKDVITAGEQLRISTEIRELFERLGGCRLHNHYGPTETHVVTALTLAGDSAAWPALPPIGRPIANTQIYVLDGQMQPIPIGVAGEIYIGGANVARGYLNRPDLTEQRFVVDLYGGEPNGRLYKTGDLGRWTEDGCLEYLGRNDEQVKVRGFRIELGEIEAQLVRHAQVREAVVLAREDEPGEKRLVGYVVAREAAAAPSAEVLREHLKAVVPEYMVPSAFMVLAALPLTPNGKLDRRALPAPDLSAYSRREYEAPSGEVEEILAGIWQELLHVERVGRNDNFFELGGHSLLIVQMLERLRRVGLSGQVRRVFESPTLSDLAGSLMRGAAEEIEVPPNLIPEGCARITPQMLPLIELEQEHIERIVEAVPGGAANIQDIYPLAPLQEGILFHHLLNGPQKDAYVRPMLYETSSRERLEGLLAALQAVIDRHDILRTAVLWEGVAKAVQVVYRQATLSVESISLDPERDELEQLKERMTPQCQRLDLRRAPLVKVQVAGASDGVRWYAIVCTHHLVCDNESLDILFEELAAYLKGHAGELSRPKPYRDHVAQALAYARSRDAQTFFRSKLGDIEEPTAPFGLMEVRGDGSQIQGAHKDLEVELGKRLRQQARRLGVTAATMFHAAWALAISKVSGREDVVFGTVLVGRLHGSAGAQRVLGMFINTLPLRLDMQGLTTKELIEHTQRELMELLGYEQASLAEAQRCSALREAAPLFTALLNYRHSVQKAPIDTPSGVALLASHGRTNYPMLLSVDDRGDGFGLEMETDRRIDPQRMLGYVCTAVESLIESLESWPHTQALTLRVLPAAERLEVLEGFNPVQEYRQERLLQELFEGQVRLHPQAIAVSCEGESLTYAELNGRANQLAWHLRDCGVGADKLVGICMERSLEMVVGLLGILKAGGAYVPLDPSYPRERLAYMLQDAAPSVLLTQQRLKGCLPQSVAEVVAIDTDWELIGKRPTRDPALRPQGLSAQSLAYVIYTSGSTGKPKGVMVEHRNVARLLAATEDWFRFNDRDVWTLFHSFAFDFSVWELWGALLYGGRLVIVPHLIARSPQEFYQLVCREGVTVLNQTPSAFAQLIQAQRECPDLKHVLRAVIFGGEALEFRILQSWIERNGTE